jgi:hypothetical protein
MFTLLTDFNIAGIKANYIHCDDSGVCKTCQSNAYLIKFEFSGPRTSQLNQQYILDMSEDNKASPWECTKVL